MEITPYINGVLIFIPIRIFSVSFLLPSIKEIERKRKSLGLTQKKLAYLTGVSQSLIAKIESGHINPSYEKAKAIFDFLEGLERKRDVKVLEIMSRKIIGISRNDPISKASLIMSKTGFSQLPVFDNDRVIGSVTEKALLNEMLKHDDPNELSAWPIEKVMEEAFPRVESLTPISIASSLLQYAPAVLVTEKGSIVGIITKADLIKVIQ